MQSDWFTESTKSRFKTKLLESITFIVRKPQNALFNRKFIQSANIYPFQFSHRYALPLSLSYSEPRCSALALPFPIRVCVVGVLCCYCDARKRSVENRKRNRTDVYSMCLSVVQNKIRFKRTTDVPIHRRQQFNSANSVRFHVR